jgi:N-acetylglucosamine kinase-like BadF-type ATPase
MILIADSGSSKTDWKCLLKDKTMAEFSTTGLNPIFTKKQDIKKIIEKDMPESICQDGIQSIFFYGAGCYENKYKITIQKIFQEYFPTARVEIHTDLIGTARALFGKEQGVTGILGTGANSGFYDGNSITKHIRPLGYILGDEGSGAYFGKKLLDDYYHGAMPSELKELFELGYVTRKEEVIDKLYNDKKPNYFLAGYTNFLKEHKNHPYAISLIKEGFSKYFEYYIKPYLNHHTYTARFSGGIGYQFQDLLRETGEKFNIKIDKIVKTPIEQLAAYHGPRN